MAAGAPTSSSTSVGAGGGTSAGSGSSSASTGTANLDTNVNVMTQLPKDVTWHDKALYENGSKIALPDGYSYKDGGVLGPDDRFYFAPDGEHNGVVIAPMRCRNGKYDYSKPVSSGNWLGSLVDSALKACAGVYDAAYNVISTAFAGGGQSGYGNSSC